MSAILDVRGLSVSYGGVKAVEEVDLRVEPGKCVGLIGPNGAGKTSFVDAITGFTPVVGGSVNFGGEEIGGMGPDERARIGMVRTFQSLELFDDISVGENLLVMAEGEGFFTWLRDAVLPKVDEQAQARAEKALAALDLEWSVDRLPRDLSHGQRKLVSVARALAGEPRLVVLDEPAAGLDADESLDLGKRLRGLTDTGLSVLLIDHDMSLVLSVCDYVYVLDFGRLIGSGTPAEVRHDSAVIEAYLGHAPDEEQKSG